MDIVSLIRYVSEHNDRVSGALVAFLLITSILLLVRSINERKEAAAGAVTDARINLDEIEAVIKRVLGPQPAAVEGAAPVVNAPADVQGAISEREARILDLSGQLEKMKTELVAKPAGVANEAAMVELQKRIDELQARLAEYEIIEDDIADLSRFKDENASLRAEVERLQAGRAAEAPASAAPAPTANVEAEFATAIPPVSTDAPEKFELDTTDEVMRQFAQAVETDAPAADPEVTNQVSAAPEAEAPPAPVEPEPVEAAVVETPFTDIDDLFAGAITSEPAPMPAPVVAAAKADETASDEPLEINVDTDKMLSEVASFGPGDDSVSALEEVVDTDRLLAEATDFSGGSATTPAPEKKVERAPLAASTKLNDEIDSDELASLEAAASQGSIADEDDLLASSAIQR